MAKAVLQKFWNWLVYNPDASRDFNLEDPNQKIDGKAVSELFGGHPTYTNITVSEDNALKFSAVWAANRIITDPISYMGVKVYQKQGLNRMERPDHPVNKLFTRPNKYSNWTTSIKRFITHRNLWGNGLYEIEYDSGRGGGDIKAIHPIHPSRIKEVYLTEDKLVFEVYGKENKVRKIDGELILHLPGLGDDLIGKSIIQYAKEDIGLEFAVQKYGAEVYNEGGDPRGALFLKQDLQPEQYEQATSKIRDQKKKSKTIVVGGGGDYKPFAMNPVDAEFIKSRHFNVSTIARWFGVPSWKLAEHSEGGSTFNNIESMGIAFLQDTIAPIIASIENEFNNKLFREEEIEDGYYIEFNMDSYLRADAQARADMWRTQIQNAIKTPNEIRKMSNDAPIDGGDELFIQQNMMPLSMAKDILRNKNGTQTDTSTDKRSK